MNNVICLWCCKSSSHLHCISCPDSAFFLFPSFYFPTESVLLHIVMWLLVCSPYIFFTFLKFIYTNVGKTFFSELFYKLSRNIYLLPRPCGQYAYTDEFPKLFSFVIRFIYFLNSFIINVGTKHILNYESYPLLQSHRICFLTGKWGSRDSELSVHSLNLDILALSVRGGT